MMGHITDREISEYINSFNLKCHNIEHFAVKALEYKNLYDNVNEQNLDYYQRINELIGDNHKLQAENIALRKENLNAIESDIADGLIQMMQCIAFMENRMREIVQQHPTLQGYRSFNFLKSLITKI